MFCGYKKQPIKSVRAANSVHEPTFECLCKPCYVLSTACSRRKKKLFCISTVQHMKVSKMQWTENRFAEARTHTTKSYYTNT